MGEEGLVAEGEEAFLVPSWEHWLMALVLGLGLASFLLGLYDG